MHTLHGFFFFLCVCEVIFCICLLFLTPFAIILTILYFLPGNEMQFSGGKRKKLRLTGDQRTASYPHSLQFYLEPPSESISLIEFESLAIDRVKCE